MLREHCVKGREEDYKNHKSLRTVTKSSLLDIPGPKNSGTPERMCYQCKAGPGNTIIDLKGVHEHLPQTENCSQLVASGNQSVGFL